MVFWQQQKLERKPRRIRSDHHEPFVFENQSAPVMALLVDYVAENTALLQGIIVPGSLQFLLDTQLHDGQGNQLRVWMFETGARFGTVVLENQEIAKPHVFRQVQNAVAVGP